MNPIETTLSDLPLSPPVTDQEFYLFHSIERKVYTWLISDLRRDPIESVYVMAFWIWLEREAHDSTMIERMLIYPGEAVNKLADETVVCLRSLKAFFEWELTHLPNVMPDPSTLSLRFLHENRTEVASRITKILSTVCARAFVNIALSAVNGEPLPPLHDKAAVAGGLPGDYIHMQCDEMLGKRFGDALCRVFLNQIDGNQEKEQEEVDDYPVDRTVFLKFLDGSRLTANEIIKFFTRICGKVIEKLTMPEDARRSRLGAHAFMVVRSAAVANAIHGTDMTEYVVNGNLVRARSCVKKQQHYFSTMSPWDEHSILERGHER